MSLQLCQCGRDGRYTHVCGAMYVAGTVTAGALSFEPAPQPPADAATCAYCGRVRSNLWHKVTSDPGTHAFVELTPPAAPPVSGDGYEAVVREIANFWYGRYVGPHLPELQHSMLPNAVREALERGRALGAREERSAGMVAAWEEVIDELLSPIEDDDDLRGTLDTWIEREIARRSGGQGK
jgi:hypothetical protein